MRGTIGCRPRVYGFYKTTYRAKMCLESCNPLSGQNVPGMVPLYLTVSLTLAHVATLSGGHLAPIYPATGKIGGVTLSGAHRHSGRP